MPKARPAAFPNTSKHGHRSALCHRNVSTIGDSQIATLPATPKTDAKSCNRRPPHRDFRCGLRLFRRIGLPCLCVVGPRTHHPVPKGIPGGGTPSQRNLGPTGGRVDTRRTGATPGLWVLDSVLRIPPLGPVYCPPPPAPPNSTSLAFTSATSAIWQFSIVSAWSQGAVRMPPTVSTRERT